MTRRQFLSACVVFVAAWVTGIGGARLRPMLARIASEKQSEFNGWPVGFLDCTTSTSIHGLNTSTYTAWRAA